MDRYTVDLDSRTDDLRVIIGYFFWNLINTIQVDVSKRSLGTYKIDDFVLAIF